MSKIVEKEISLMMGIMESLRIKLNSHNQKEKTNAEMILNHFDTNKKMVRKTLEKYSSWGLSYVHNDFYVLVRSRQVQMPLDYKAYARLAVQNAREAGYDLILEAGVIREGFKKGFISRLDNGDEILVLANPIAGAIVSPWAKYKLISQKTHEVVSSLIEVVPHDEYVLAMGAGGYNGSVGHIHTTYATEGAKKIALRRAIKHISYMFPSMRELEIIDNESFIHETSEIIPQSDPTEQVEEQPKSGLSKYED